MKTIRISIIIISIIFILCYLIYFFGFYEFQKNTDTPKEYLSHTINNQKDYEKDSIEIAKNIRNHLLIHQSPFENPEYFDSTIVIVDTILYDNNFDKFMAIVILQNPTYRQIASAGGYLWYFDGYGYVGTRKNDSLELYDIEYSVYYNFHNQSEISIALRTEFFRRLFYIKDSNNQSRYKYNVNDTRFWNGPIWEEVEQRKEARRRFEILKKTHPEDVSEPKY